MNRPIGSLRETATSSVKPSGFHVLRGVDFHAVVLRTIDAAFGTPHATVRCPKPSSGCLFQSVHSSWQTGERHLRDPNFALRDDERSLRIEVLIPR